MPGSLHIARNVLEWRLDPRCEARLAETAGYDTDLIVMCSHGYASSLAAVSLQNIGLRNATDMTGGFLASAAAGLPVLAEASEPTADG